MKYFKFHNNKFNTESNSGSYSFWHKFLQYFIKKISCNPDFEENCKNINFWYIEFDDAEFHLAIKEMGVDKNGKVVFWAPSKRNYGYWCDSDVDIELYKQFNITYITKDEFYAYWNTCIK